ncbi:MAG: folate hydrolase, partial [Gemmatimonadetes bacterium]|nr:folate hydrolase [Gemmatimonadota bacterium]
MAVPTRSLTAGAALTALLAFTPARTADPDLLGFTAAGAQAQMELEARYASMLQASNLEEWMRYIVSKPIYTGSPHNKETAEWMVEQLRSWGFEAELEEFQVLFPMPKVRQLEMVAPTRFRARLEEPELREDAASRVRQDRLPTYNAYSADGDVTGELVYVNYGIPADYEELARRGIDVRGKI